MFDLWRAWHRWDIRRRVRRHGWTAIYVGQYGEGLTWAYSVGFGLTLEAPEVIVFDLPQETANGLFWEVFRQLQSGELVIRDDEAWTEEEGGRTVWRRVHPRRLEDDEEPWLGAAQTFNAQSAKGTREFEAFQLVLSDPARRMPWEPGYDERLRPLQRALYLPSEPDLGG